MSSDLSEVTQRGKQYLETARTLLRTAKTMTDQTIAVSPRRLPRTTSGAPRKLHVSTRPEREHFEMPAIALEDWKGKP